MIIGRIVCLLAASALVGLASDALAEHGQPSDSMLSAMGLSGLNVMSDGESMTIRGHGYGGHYGYYAPKPKAVAYGSSYARVATHGARAGSHDGFYAEGRYRAYGAHGSVAGVVIKRSGGGHHGGYGGWGGGHDYGGGHHPKPKAKKIVAFSGGFSFASTK